MHIIPDTLYKYRQFENEDCEESYGRHTLTRSAVFAASPSSFNDPFDNALPYRYTKESLTQENFIDIYISTSNKKNVSRESLIYEATDRYNYIIDNPKKHWSEYKDEIFEMDSKFYGIVSLAKKPDNILMWSHYSDYHKGYCLGFSMEIFQQFLTNNFQQYGLTLGPIDYKEKYPELDFREIGNRKHSAQRGFTKHTCWGYEDEYRIVLNNGANLVLNYPKDMLTEVYLGCKMNPENRKEIIAFLRDNHLNVKLYQMEMSFDKFALDPIEISYK